MNGRTISLAAWMLLSPLLGACGTTVEVGQRGMFLSPLGKGLHQEERGEGFYWTLPWNGYVTYDVRWESRQEKVEVLSKDDLHMRVDASITPRPRPGELYPLSREVGPEFYEAVVRPVFLTTVRSAIAEVAMVDIPESGPEIEKAVLATVSERLAGRHIEIGRVTLDHVEFTQAVLRSIEGKLAKEEELRQRAFELEIAAKDAEILHNRARGEAEAARARAEGEADALRIRAQGQAEAQASITKTLTPDYLRYKAFDSANAKFYFLPLGKDGLPLILGPQVAVEDR